MDSSYEKRLMGSPYTSPVKATIKSPLTSPAKEVYSDRFIPIRANSRWEQSDIALQLGAKFSSPTSKPKAGTISVTSLTLPLNMSHSLASNNPPMAPSLGPPPGSAYSYHYYHSESNLLDLSADNAALRATTTTGLGATTTTSGATGVSAITTVGPGGSSLSNTSLIGGLSHVHSAGTLGSQNEPLPTDFYTSLVTNELYTANISDYVDCSYQRGQSALLERENTNLFSFKLRKEDPEKLKLSPYSLSPLSDRSHRLLKQPRRLVRKIPKTPYKVLDAPELQDDFYLNLVDWSSANILAVGLGSCVYLWNALTSQVTRLCDLTNDNDTITSVSWAEKASLLAVGTHRGTVQIWDVRETRRVRQMDGHSARVGALAWNGDLIVSGSRDRTLRLRDVRESPSSASSLMGTAVTGGGGGVSLRVGGGMPSNVLLGVTSSPGGNSVASQSLSMSGNTGANPLLPPGPTSSSNNWVVTEHRQEVCGLKWSPSRQLLASGGNDNRLLVWSLAMGFQRPMLAFEQHVAAVKAIDWSPHQHGLLASGGGTADKCIRFWNTLTGQPLQCIDTGSQVCNIAWSKHSNELVSTHGYSQHQIILWSYPSLRQSAKLLGHTYRVLYLATSPCGENIVTGAGDETLRFWNVFAKAKVVKPIHSAMGLFDSGIR